MLGIVLAVLCRGLVRALAAERSRTADEALRAAVHEVLDAEVVRPTAGQLAAHNRFRTGIAHATAPAPAAPPA